MRTRAVEVFYDGWCPMCTGIKGRLSRLDWLRLVEFRSFREQGALADAGVPAERLAARMHARHRSTGRVVDGIWAVAAVAARVPVLMPLWPLVLLSGYLGIGQWAYDLIASRRSIVPVGHCNETGCEIHDRKPE